MSVKELEKSIISFIEKHNDDPTPFVWTKYAEEILAKVDRARATLNKLQAV